MKLLHTADLHIGDSRNLPGYLDRQRKMLYWLSDQAQQHDVDVLVIAGDIFDTKHIMPRERDMFMDWLLDNDREAKKARYVTLMIGGNHDEIESEYTHLHGLKRLMQRNVLERTIVVDVHAHCLPIKSKHEPVRTAWFACMPAANYKRDELSTAVRAFRASLDAKAEKSGEAVQYFVAVVHEPIAGAVNETGTYQAKGPTIDTSIDVTYWALGDIHKPYQQITPNAWYPGSPIQHEFGDVSPKRGALLVDLDDPTNPTPLQVEGITPLLTLYDWPEIWPDDAIVRFQGTAEEIASGRFPDNVIAFKPLVEIKTDEVVSIDLAGYALLDGLTAILADQGIPADYWDGIGDALRNALDECR